MDKCVDNVYGEAWDLSAEDVKVLLLLNANDVLSVKNLNNLQQLLNRLCDTMRYYCILIPHIY